VRQQHSVLPLQFKKGENRESLKLTGKEVFSLTGIADSSFTEAEQKMKRRRYVDGIEKWEKGKEYTTKKLKSKMGENLLALGNELYNGAMDDSYKSAVGDIEVGDYEAALEHLSSTRNFGKKGDASLPANLSTIETKTKQLLKARDELLELIKPEEEE